MDLLLLTGFYSEEVAFEGRIFSLNRLKQYRKMGINVNVVSVTIEDGIYSSFIKRILVCSNAQNNINIENKDLRWIVIVVKPNLLYVLYIYRMERQIGRTVICLGECLKLQFESDFLFLLIWNTRNEKEVYACKFLDHMLIGNLVFTLLAGDSPGSEVAVVIDESNLRTDIKKYNKAIDFSKLKVYIKIQYDLYIHNDTIALSPNRSVIERYNYRNIVGKHKTIIYG